MIGVAVIGCGFIAGLHLDAYRRLARDGWPLRVVAAADPLPGRAAAFAREHGIEAAYEDHAGALAHPGVTAVDVCTPNPSHREVAVAAAEAGKHVFLEKPIALTLDEADAIVEACARAGVRLMVGQSMRFDSVNRELKALVESGEIGTPAYVATTSLSGYFWPGGWRAWQIDPARSGGNLVQNGIHDLDLFCWLLGEAPVRLLARGARLASAALETFDCYHVALSFPSGATALTTYGYSAVPPDAALRTLYVEGSDGEARYEWSADGGVFTSRGLDHAVLPGPYLYYRELEHFADCLERGVEPLVRPAQARLALELALAAEESALSGEAVAFDERAYA